MNYARMNTSSSATQTETTVLEFLETAYALDRRLDRALSNARGISFSEYRLLRTLSKSGAVWFPRVDLAYAVGLTASAITRALKPLEKLGYVTAERGERGISLASGIWRRLNHPSRRDQCTNTKHKRI